MLPSGAGPAAAGPVSVERRPGGVAVLTLTKEPVNSLDMAAWQALDDALAALEADSTVSAVVLASGLSRDVFSAGNDLAELYAPGTTYERYAAFWRTQNAFLVRLYRSRLATVAAIRGACPAGGCIISLCCDVRLMTPEGMIGLNEVQLGIPVPKFWGAVMVAIIGGHASEELLLAGHMASPQQAKALGLVDALIDKPQLLPAAEAAAAKLARLPAEARAATKLSLRAELAAGWEAFYPVEPQGAWVFLNAPATLKALGGAMQRLSSSAKKDKASVPGAVQAKL